jgi:two-component system chemotaxis sensor kinase CheA
VDHGLESPSDRASVGKPPSGTVRVRVAREGRNVVIEVSDDGRGMSPRKLCDKAVSKGLLTRAEADGLTREQAFALIFRPGFSTAEKVTNISGRGVGMDVVQTNIRQLSGNVRVESMEGRGTTFTVKLPRGIMVCRGILVEVGSEPYVLPVDDVREMLKLRDEEVHDFLGFRFISRRGSVCPVVSLPALLGTGTSTDGPAAASTGEVRSAAVVRTRRGDVALVVDRLLSEVEVLVKPLSSSLSQLPVFQGASILGDGRIALVLAPAEMDGSVSGGPS